eukprot:3289718-Pyramimonas_sp.AAC.2
MSNQDIASTRVSRTLSPAYVKRVDSLVSVSWEMFSCSASTPPRATVEFVLTCHCGSSEPTNRDVDGKGYKVDVDVHATGDDVDVKGYGVDVKGYNVDGKGYTVGVKGYNADVKGYNVDVKGYNADVKGYKVAVKGSRLRVEPASHAAAALAVGEGAVEHLREQ